MRALGEQLEQKRTSSPKVASVGVKRVDLRIGKAEFMGENCTSRALVAMHSKRVGIARRIYRDGGRLIGFGAMPLVAFRSSFTRKNRSRKNGIRDRAKN